MAYDFSEHLKRYGPDASFVTPSLAASEEYCGGLACSHYENFSVVVRFTPKRLRRHLCNIYAYCRWADDLADETSGGERTLALLDWWEDLLDRCYANQDVSHPVFQALTATIHEFSIPREPFANLLSAFREDQRKFRYADMAELLTYCENSANPVGRIILSLAGCASPERMNSSDKICTGLQLANFWQDVARDRKIGRIYIPLDVMDRYGVEEGDLDGEAASPALRSALKELVDDAERRLKGGLELTRRVPPWPGREIDLFARGGLGVLSKIRRLEYDVLKKRPTLSKADKFLIMTRVVIAGAARFKRS